MINAYAAFKAKGELQSYQYDPGHLAANHVEIDVINSGLCHSDLNMIDNDWGITQFPLVPGHEVIGKISQIGDDVTQFHVGQVVGLGWHASYCNQCHHCHGGDHNLCSHLQPTIVGHHGGFADKVRAQATSVVALPEGIDLRSAGPLFCGGITVFNPLVQFDIKPTAKVGVIGIGGLGHIALQFLRAWGCEVTAFTSTESKKTEALTLGAHHTINSTDADALQAAAGQFDLILSTVNVDLDWGIYLNALVPKGRLHFVGFPSSPISLSSFPLILGQRSISGSPVGSPETIRQMLEFAHLHNIQPIVEYFKFSQINEAITKLKQGNVRYRIVLEH